MITSFAFVLYPILLYLIPSLKVFLFAGFHSQIADIEFKWTVISYHGEY